MPTLSVFYGLTIMMYFAPEHNPPHIHIRYQNDYAMMEINTCEIIGGKISERNKRLVQAWVEIHREELMENWRLCQSGCKPIKIKPLM